MIARKSNREVNQELAVKMAKGVVAAILAYKDESGELVTLLNYIPHAGHLSAIGVNSILNYVFTYTLGCALAKAFAESESDESDVNQMILTLGSSAARWPGVDEMRDMLSLAREPVDLSLFKALRQS